MVRAATTGSFDYSHADPYDKRWRVKHSLVLQAVSNELDADILKTVHQHWLAYVSHSSLEPDSWTNVKKQANKTLKTLQTVVLPWHQSASENTNKEDTIKSEYGDLIAQYKNLVAAKAQERNAAGNAGKVES